MREILFRGKRLDNGEWVYGDLMQTQTQNDTQIVAQKEYALFVCVDPKTIGQYTGLKDKNGEKLFEGDVLEWDVVEWGGPQRELVKYEYDLLSYRFDDWSSFCEVIGNIHDNPELLEV